MWWMIGGWVVTALGLGLVGWAMFADRARGRRRCRRCWYDMVAVDGLLCPECGHEHRDARRLLATRRRWAFVWLALVPLLGGWALRLTPKYQRGGVAAITPDFVVALNASSWSGPALAQTDHRYRRRVDRLMRDEDVSDSTRRLVVDRALRVLADADASNNRRAGAASILFHSSREYSRWRESLMSIEHWSSLGLEAPERHVTGAAHDRSYASFSGDRYTTYIDATLAGLRSTDPATQQEATYLANQLVPLRRPGPDDELVDDDAFAAYRRLYGTVASFASAPGGLGESTLAWLGSESHPELWSLVPRLSRLGWPEQTTSVAELRAWRDLDPPALFERMRRATAHEDERVVVLALLGLASPIEGSPSPEAAEAELRAALERDSALVRSVALWVLAQWADQALVSLDASVLAEALADDDVEVWSQAALLADCCHDDDRIRNRLVSILMRGLPAAHEGQRGWKWAARGLRDAPPQPMLIDWLVERITSGPPDDEGRLAAWTEVFDVASLAGEDPRLLAWLEDVVRRGPPARPERAEDEPYRAFRPDFNPAYDAWTESLDLLSEIDPLMAETLVLEWIERESYSDRALDEIANFLNWESPRGDWSSLEELAARLYMEDDRAKRRLLGAKILEGLRRAPDAAYRRAVADLADASTAPDAQDAAWWLAHIDAEAWLGAEPDTLDTLEGAYLRSRDTRRRRLIAAVLEELEIVSPALVADARTELLATDDEAVQSTCLMLLGLAEFDRPDSELRLKLVELSGSNDFEFSGVDFILSRLQRASED
ncbi:MAG: hypothetical protein AAFR38_09740 [Planctomycetota bacterium]